MSYDYTKVSREFPTEEALKEYLAKHPKADKSRHRVKKQDGETKPSKPEEKGGFEGQWGEALSRQLGRPATKDDLDVLRGQMKEFVQKEKKKDEPVFDLRSEDEKPQEKKPDPKDPFVQQWGETLSRQLGRPATQDDIDILKGKMKGFIQKTKTASTRVRVYYRFLAL